MFILISVIELNFLFQNKKKYLELISGRKVTGLMIAVCLEDTTTSIRWPNTNELTTWVRIAMKCTPSVQMSSKVPQSAWSSLTQSRNEQLSRRILSLFLLSFLRCNQINEVLELYVIPKIIRFRLRFSGNLVFTDRWNNRCY